MDEGIRARLGLPAPDAGKPMRELRIFGCGLAVFLALTAGLAWRRGSGLAPWEFSLAAFLFLLAGLKPDAFKPLHTPWMKAAQSIGKANAYLLMALVYYLLITPYGALIRLLGHDLLDEKLRDRESYWHLKGPPPGPESYQNQF